LNGRHAAASTAPTLIRHWASYVVVRNIFILLRRIRRFFVVAASCAEKTAERQQQQQRVETDNDDDREVPPPPTSSANHDDDDDGRSRDPATMTSSEPERGDSAAECQQAETPPSVDSDNDNVVAGDEGQTYTQAAATSADGTSSPGADRKQNSDEPEASSAGASGTPWFSL